MSLHELGSIHNLALTNKQNYIEDKNKQVKSASGFYYGIIGNVTLYNRIYDRYHVTIPELNNSYYQNVPRRHDYVNDGSGTIPNTYKLGDNVLIAFQGGLFSNPIIVGSQFYTGDPSVFIDKINRGGIDTMVNIIAPPTSQGEAVKVMASSGGAITVQTKDNNIPSNAVIRATLKDKKTVNLEVFSRTTGISTSIRSSKQVIVTNGSKYESTTGNQYSISEGLLVKGKEQAANLAVALRTSVQTYTTTSTSLSPLDITYVSSGIPVPGQVLVDNQGKTYNYGSKSSGTSSLTTDDEGNIIAINSVTDSSSNVDYDKVNSSLTDISDTLKTAREQSKYEQEVLLPCVENIKRIWDIANYLLNNSFEYSDPKFSLSYLCNLGSFKVKASFPPLGSIEQEIDYCAPAWLTVPLLLVKGLYDLGCSNAWRTDFLNKFNSSVNNEMSLMVCCDDNGLPTVGYNIASSLDISSSFAISGAPIPLRDTGSLPNSVTIRPSSKTTINIAAPDITKDISNVPVAIGQKDANGVVRKDHTFIPPSKPTVNLDTPKGTKPSLSTLGPPLSYNDFDDITEPYNGNLDLPVGLVEYELPSTQLSLDLPLPTYNFKPYKVNKDTITNNPYSAFENTLVNYGIPNAELLLSELKYLIKTKSVHNFFQILSLVSQRPLVSLIFNLINVYIQGDLTLNLYIYKLKLKSDVPVEVKLLFDYALNRDLTSLETNLNSYFGIEVDILSSIYNPISMLDWILIHEPAVQPLFISLQQAAIEDFCVLLVRVFNGIDLKMFESLYKIYVSLCQQSLNISVQGSNFYKADNNKIYIPESQLT